ncbi:MAG: universal stress protein [Gemmataceae bacterium]
MFTIRRILHPTDFSEAAASAFALACSLARDHHAEVLLLHVLPAPVAWGEVVARRQADGYEQELREEYLRPMQRSAGDVCAEPLLDEGDPVDVIIRTACEQGCDLIVMGTHGRSGLSRLLMGSVAERVLRRAPCPVLTVRLPIPVARPVAAAVVADTEGVDTLPRAVLVEQPTLPLPS